MAVLPVACGASERADPSGSGAAAGAGEPGGSAGASLSGAGHGGDSGRASGGTAGSASGSPAAGATSQSAGEGGEATAGTDGGGAGGTEELERGVVLAAGHYNTCYVKPDGTPWCWGTRSQVQVCEPDCITEPPHPVPGLTDVLEIAVGIVHACALGADRQVRCWGGNSVGAVGPFEAGDDLAPRIVELGEPVRHVAAGVEFSCAVLESGRTVCWGATPSFAVSGGGSTAPEPVADLAAPSFAAGAYEHACAIVEGGNVECWGLPRWGKLGEGEPTGTDPASPIRVSGLSGVVRLDSAPNRNCALLGVGDPICWGRDIERPPTTANGVEQPVPAPFPLGVPVSRVALGGYHACAVTEDAKVRCWGANFSGQLGIEDTEEHEGPVEVVGLNDVIDLAAGADHTCALTRELEVWCWGSNANQELGSTTAEAFSAPIRVELPD